MHDDWLNYRHKWNVTNHAKSFYGLMIKLGKVNAKKMDLNREGKSKKRCHRWDLNRGWPQWSQPQGANQLVISRIVHSPNLSLLLNCAASPPETLSSAPLNT